MSTTDKFTLVYSSLVTPSPYTSKAHVARQCVERSRIMFILESDKRKLAQFNEFSLTGKSSNRPLVWTATWLSRLKDNTMVHAKFASDPKSQYTRYGLPHLSSTSYTPDEGRCVLGKISAHVCGFKGRERLTLHRQLNRLLLKLNGA